MYYPFIPIFRLKIKYSEESNEGGREDDQGKKEGPSATRREGQEALPQWLIL
jgi:hypothetical protein